MLLTALALCLATTLAGVGILNFVRARLAGDGIMFLAPCVCISVWTLYVGCVALAGVPFENAWQALWGLTFVAAIYGAVRFRWGEALRSTPAVAIALLSAVVATWPFARYGYETFVGSSGQDGWSYVALGQYLWRYPRGTEGGLAPLYQYAAHLSHTRFVSAGLLGVLSPLGAVVGDTQKPVGYLLCLAFYVQASACMFFAGVVRMPALSRFAFVLVAVASTWSIFVLTMNNFDNALFLHVMPAALGVVIGARAEARGDGIILGILLASSAVIYPELFGLVLLVAGIWAVQRLHQSDRGERKRFAWSVLVPAVVVVGVTTMVFQAELTHFLLGQLTTMKLASKPGWDVAGFVPAERVGLAFFGLSQIVASHPALRLPISILCFILVIFVMAGVATQYRRRNWAALITLVLFVTGLSYFCFVSRYGYGAYKLGLEFWWLVAFFIVEGLLIVQAALPVASKWTRLGSHGANGAVTLSVMACGLLASYDLIRSLDEKTITPFEQVTAVTGIAKDRPVLAILPDVTSNLWAMYFLRDAPLEFATFEGYPAQEHVLPFMKRSRHYEVKEGGLILISGADDVMSPTGSKHVLWRNARYQLLDSLGDNGAIFSGLTNPNGVERWDGKPGFWLDEREATFRIRAARDGTALVTAEIIPGPSMPDTQRREVHFRRSDGIETTTVTEGRGPHSFAVPVHEGENRFSVWVARTSRVVVGLPNGDRRELLLGMRNPHVELAPPGSWRACCEGPGDGGHVTEGN